MIQRINKQIVNFPFKPGIFPFFYGWVVLIAGIIGVIMSVPGQTVGVSVFTDKLIDALKISRTSLSVAYMLGTGLSALIMTFAGIFYDRMGARLMASVSALFLAGVLVLLSQIDHVVFFIQNLLDVHSVAVTMIVVTLSFFLLRLFGQGILTMVSRNMVMKWFDRYRGLANGILGIMISFGFSYAPRYFNDLIEASNWRLAWMNIALILLGFTVFAFLFFRDDPFECNQKPDGLPVANAGSDNAVKKQQVRNFTLAETIRTYSFWMFNLGLFLSGLFVTAFTFHVVSIFDTASLSKETAISIFLPAALISVAFHFAGSLLSDYIPLKYLLLTLILGLLLSMISVLFLQNSLFYKILILGNGISTGMFGTLIAVTWPKLYGTKHLGAISGFALSWVVAGSAVGPFFLSLSFKYTAKYTLSLHFLIIFTIILFILSSFLKEN